MRGPMPNEAELSHGGVVRPTMASMKPYTVTKGASAANKVGDKRESEFRVNTSHTRQPPAKIALYAFPRELRAETESSMQ